jgi:SAM-dependent methyltransferase
MNVTPAKTVNNETIKDFGAQWTRYTSNAGYYGSTELLADILHPLVELDEIRGRRVAEIGSGTGRIVNMLVEAVSCQHAFEPSRAFQVLQRNTELYRERINMCTALARTCQRARISTSSSDGVLHHIEEPKPVVNAAFRALRPAGQSSGSTAAREGSMCVWCGGSECSLSAAGFLLSLVAKLGAVKGRTSFWRRSAGSDARVFGHHLCQASWHRANGHLRIEPRHAYYSRAEVLQLLESCGLYRYACIIDMATADRTSKPEPVVTAGDATAGWSTDALERVDFRSRNAAGRVP